MNIMDRTQKRMNTSIEIVFKKLPDGTCREYMLHFINFLSDDGKIESSKLDKRIPGRLFKIATGNERSLYGEVEYTFPGEDTPVRLVALGMSPRDQLYNGR